MIPPLATCELPATVQPGHLLATYQGTPEVMVIIARPGSKNAIVPLIRDLIIATSTTPTPTAMPKPEATLANIALARLIGYRIKHVLLCSSEHLPRECLSTITELVIPSGATLTLTYGYDAGEAVRTWGDTMCAPDLDWPNIHPLLPDPTTPRDSAAHDFPDEVPWVDFPLFRAASRRCLNPDDFTAVDRLYCDTYRAIQQAHPVTTDEATNALRDLLTRIDQPAQTFTIVRAAQAALLTLGYLLKVDVRHLYLLTAKDLNRRLSSRELLRLRDDPLPHMGAIPVLADANLDDDDICALRLSDISPTGTLTTPALPLLAAGADLIATQRYYRLFEGGTPEEPLIDNIRRTIPTALREAAKRGLPVDTRRAMTAKADRWQHQTGISLQEIS